MAADRVHLRILQPLAIWLGGRGVDVDGWLAGCGLGRADLASAETHIGFATFCALWESAAAGEPDVGLLVGSFVASVLPFTGTHASDFVVGKLLATSDTAGDGLRRVARFQRVTVPPVRYAIRSHPGDLTSFHLRFDGPQPPRAAVDFLVAWPLAALGALAGAPVTPVRSTLAYPAPARTSVHRELFGPDVAFGAGESGFTLTGAQWRLPLATADRGLCTELERRASRALDGEGDLAARVRTAAGAGGADRVARALGMSARTLTRRLAEEGASFREIVDADRERRARELLDAGRPLAEVARAVGYSDERALRRALRRWGQAGD